MMICVGNLSLDASKQAYGLSLFYLVITNMYAVSLHVLLPVCMCACVFLASRVKHAAGDKGLQRQSSANECKMLWQPKRVTPSVSPLGFLFIFSSTSLSPFLYLFLTLYWCLLIFSQISPYLCFSCTPLFWIFLSLTPSLLICVSIF